ncbi:hypothetical protein HDU97_006005 [Phlyctochytrium planicorne]|nr:hypothetical protein HDU97_006005 [Phlyctochytrium planicorne]
MQLEEFVAAINQLYSPASSPQGRKAAEDWLQEFQRSREAWDLSRSLLISSTSEEIRFFAASTLVVKVARDWEEIKYENIQNDFIDLLCRFTAGPGNITTKLCTCLAEIMFKTVPDQWADPISYIVSYFQSQIVKEPTGPLTTSIQLCLLKFLKVLPEEMRRTVFAAETRRARFHSTITAEVPVVMSCVTSVLKMSIPADSSSPASKMILSIKLMALECVLSWALLDGGVPLDYIGSTIELVVAHLSIRETYERAAAVLVDLLSLPSLRPYSETICHLLLPVLTSGWLRDEYVKGIENLDPATIKPVCEILAAMGERFPSFIVQHMAQPQVITLLEMLLACTGFSGFYGVDEEISLRDIPTEFWCEIQEVLTEELVYKKPSTSANDPMFPTHNLTTDPATGRPILHGSGSSPLRLDLHNIKAPLKPDARLATSRDQVCLWEAESGGSTAVDADEKARRVWMVAIEVYSVLVVYLKEKIRWPDEEEKAAWEQRDQFRHYRMTMTDTLLSCYRVLGAAMENYLAASSILDCSMLYVSIQSIIPGIQNATFQHMQSVAPPPTDVYERVEASLFCVKAIAEEIALNSSQHLGYILGEPVLGVIYQLLGIINQVGNEVPDMFRKQVSQIVHAMCIVLAVERHPQWLSRHDTYVIPVIRFLQQAAGVKAASRAAIYALDDICDHCRHMLASLAPDMVEAWIQNSIQIGPQEQAKFLRAVCRTLQPLPPSRQLPLLIRILASLISDLQRALYHLSTISASVASASASATNAMATEGLNPSEATKQNIQTVLAATAERDFVMEGIKLLRSICQGVQPPDTTFAEDDDDEGGETSAFSNQKNFAERIDAEASYSQQIDEPLPNELLCAAREVCNGIWETVLAISSMFLRDSEMMNVMCSFINDTLNNEPSLIFQPSIQVLGTHLAQLFAANVNPCLLKSLTILVQSVDDDGPAGQTSALENAGEGATLQRIWMRDMISSVIVTCGGVLANPQGMENHPDICEAFFRFLSKVALRHLWSFLNVAQDILLPTFVLVLPLGLRSMERNSLLGTIDFVKTFIQIQIERPIALIPKHRTKRHSLRESASPMQQEDLDGMGELTKAEALKMREMKDNMFRGIGAGVVKILLHGIGGGQSSTMLSNLCGLLHLIVQRFPYESREWVVTALSEDGFPSRFCQAADKDAVLKGLHTASLKSFKEVMSRFSLKCRNLQDTAYGAATHLGNMVDEVFATRKRRLESTKDDEDPQQKHPRKESLEPEVKSHKRVEIPPHANLNSAEPLLPSLADVKLTPFQHQVAGHKDSLFKLDDHGTLAKPTTRIEAKFYEDAAGSALEEFLPKWKGIGTHPEMIRRPNTPQSTVEKKMKAKAKNDASLVADDTVVVLMEDVLHEMEAPCIADIKIGTRLYGDDASPEKIQRMKEQADVTTSGATGLRICGMKLYSHESGEFEEFGREYGRSLDARTLIDGFRLFFQRGLKDESPKNSQSTGSDTAEDKTVLSNAKEAIQRLINALRCVDCRLYGCSLLLAYSTKRNESRVRKRAANDPESTFEREASPFKKPRLELSQETSLSFDDAATIPISSLASTVLLGSLGQDLTEEDDKPEVHSVSVPGLKLALDSSISGAATSSASGGSSMAGPESLSSSSAGTAPTTIPSITLAPDVDVSEKQKQLLEARKSDGNSRDGMRVICKLIDFAHSHFSRDIGPDEGAIFGLQNLVRYIDEISLSL